MISAEFGKIAVILPKKREPDLFTFPQSAGPLDMMVLARSAVQNPVQNIARINGLVLADFGGKHGYQAFHLSLGQASIEPDVEVSLQLGIDPLHAGQNGYGGDLPAPEIQVVAPEEKG
jgi:hypothetical protein